MKRKKDWHKVTVSGYVYADSRVKAREVMEKVLNEALHLVSEQYNKKVRNSR